MLKTTENTASGTATGGVTWAASDAALGAATGVAPGAVIAWGQSWKQNLGAVLLAILLGITSLPTLALADDDAKGATAGENGVPLTALELQESVEATQLSYDEARTLADEAAALVADQEARIGEIEKEIPLQQQRSAKAARELYKIQQSSPGLVSMLVEAENLGNFLVMLEYITFVTNANLDEIHRLAALRDELAATRQALEDAQAQAEERVEEARQSLEAAVAMRDEEQRREEEEARLAAEAALNAAALEEAPRDNTSETPVKDNANSGDSGEAEKPSSSETTDNDSGPTPVDPPSNYDQATFVALWAPRIDAYLAGSPMAGCGETFAKAAYANNVDPRWSPAIACIESGKGTYCFLPHNAWGWGSASWDSWESAINDHVSGLASGYGFTITVDAAKTYCPPNWEFWYNNTSAQMNLI